MPSCQKLRSLMFGSTAVAALRHRIRDWKASAELHQRICAYLEAAPKPRPDPVQLPAPSSLAIVVACWGHAAFLETMFTSLRNQTRPPEEIVLVDDHSPDGSGEILRQLVAGTDTAASTRYSVISNDRTLGQAASLNAAIAAVSTDLVMILNADDYLMHDVAEVMLNLFARYPDVALIGATCVQFSTDDELRAAPKLISGRVPGGGPQLTVRTPADVRRYRKKNDLNMTHSGMGFRRSAWQLVGGYYPNPEDRLVRNDDRDFELRINCRYPVAVSLEIPFSFWRRNSGVGGDRQYGSVPRGSDDIGRVDAG